jgi:hypothetical protein
MQQRLSHTRPLTLLAGWLAVGSVTTVALPARAEFCPDAKGYESMSEEWIMANVCQLAQSAVSGAAKDVLSEFGKGALRTALNAYVPGLGQLIFGEEDKFAVHAQRIIDEIKRSEQTVIRTTLTRLDQIMEAMINQNKMERRAGFLALLHEWEMWNAKDWRGKADQHDQIASISSAINVLRWETQSQIVTKAAESNITVPYPYLSLLHQWTLLMTLQFEAESQEIEWAAVAKAYPQGSLLTPEQVSETFRANPDIQASSDRELRSSRIVLLDEATAFMDQLAEVGGPGRSIFLEDLKWSWPWVVPSSRVDLGNRASALPDALPCPDCAPIPGWYYGGVKAIQWKDRYWTSIKYVNDRWCAWLPVHESLVYDGIWYEVREAPLCSAQPAKIPYDPANPASTTDDSVREATQRVYDYIATHNPEYGTMLLAGYGPVRVALDQWWEGAWRLGAVTGHRPPNLLDWQLDELLFSQDPVVSRFSYNADIRANFGEAVGALYGLSGHQQPSSYEELSVLVGFGLKNGTAAFGQIGWTAAVQDGDQYWVNPDGTSSYPMFLHTHYARHRTHSPEELLKFYRDDSNAIGDFDSVEQLRFAEALQSTLHPTP